MNVSKITITVPGKPVGAPRQTGRSRFNPKKRPAIERYHAYRDAIRLFARGQQVPPAERTEEIVITAYWTPPPLWSRNKQEAAIGTKKRSKPDGDNVEKAVLDALFDEDAAVGDTCMRRRWDWTARTEIEIYYQGEP